MTLRVGLIQITAGENPADNLAPSQDLIAQAARDGAQLIATPEVTNIISTSRAHQNAVLHRQPDDPTLAALRAQAKALKIWLVIGSLALKTDDADGRFANRSFLIDPSGNIAAQYDKIHMFDVQVNETETYRESAGYRPGTTTAVAQTPFAPLGLTICYDMRFPHLYRALAQAGAAIITVPSAFSPVTGAAHWHALLRARAIETGCFILAPAQTGAHAITTGKPRQTYGHSLVVDPWGTVLLDGGTTPGAYTVDLDLAAVHTARSRVPALTHDRPYEKPKP